MQRAWRERLTRLWLGGLVAGLSLALAAPSAFAAAKEKGILDTFDRVAVHGYVDNFTILRNDTFKSDYHVASSRYRASLQLSGPIYALQEHFDRFEYFIELA